MTLESSLITLCNTVLPTTFGHADTDNPSTKFPLCVMNYISDVDERYLDNSESGYSGRMTFTLYAKNERDLITKKNTLRTTLLNAADYNFSLNTSLSEYDSNTKTFIYQIDMDFVYTG
jgi:hypothetical protein